MEATCGTGKRWPERPLHSGVQNLGIHLLTRWASPLGSADLALRGYVAPKGPILRDAPWDDILVTKARSDDGTSLDLALRPRNHTVAATLRFDALSADRAYRLVLPDAVLDLRADASGVASVEVTVDQPITARLEPA